MVLGSVALLGGIVPPPAVSAATDRLPDLRSSRPTDLRIVTSSSGRRLLRFTSQFVNDGAGPFEVRGRRPNSSVPFDIDQIIYNSDGGARRRDTNATVVYAGDGHNHYHVRRMMSYHLRSTAGTMRDRKIGFCFFDTTPKRLSLPRAPRTKKYFESGCGGRTATRTRSGVSVGWGDTRFRRSEAAVFIARALHLPPSANNHFSDDDGMPAEPAIDAMVDAGIMAGCAAGRFCPSGTVTRGQMAAWLYTAFPPAP